MPCAVCAATNVASPKYILFLTADGFRTDYLDWYKPVALTKLASEGTRIKYATNVFPTVTTPNMTSLVTGAYPHRTGIGCNVQYEAEADAIKDHLRNNHAETISETLHRAGWKTAAVNHFMLENRGTDFYVTAGYDDAEKTTDAILDLLKNKSAHFVGAIYGAADHAGHAHGPQSEEVKAAVASIDHAVGRLVDGLKEMGIYDQTLIAFNADHGMSGYESKQASIEPAAALKKAGFKVATSQAQLKSDTEVIVISEGVRLVYFRKPLSAERQQEAKNLLSKIEGAEVLDREKLDALKCHNNRSGDLIVSPLPGYTMSRAGAAGGQHGRFAERNPIMFFRGPGIKVGAMVQGANTVDVAPTLLHLAGVSPARSVEGTTIWGALSK